MKWMYLVALFFLIAAMATIITVPLSTFQRGQTTTSTQTQSRVTTLTNHDNGTVVAMRVGDALNITLNANSRFNINPTWIFNGSSNPRVLLQSGPPKYIRLSLGPCPNSPCGVDSAAFKGIAAGVATVIASEYGSCAEPAVVNDNCGSLYQESFRITVVVTNS